MRKCLKMLAVVFAAVMWLLPTMAAAAPSKSDTTGKAETVREKAARDREAKQAEANKKKDNGAKKNEAPAKKEKKAEPVLRVGLEEAQSAAVFKADNDFVVRDAVTGQGLRKGTHKDVITIAVKDRQLMLNGKPVSAKKLVLKSADSAMRTIFSYNESKYRGDFEVVLTNEGLTVINVVGLEDYIGGVLNQEMGDGWPAEALKAQAVAARTFALYTVEEQKHGDDGYDVCATTHCQAYGGMESESRSALEAVSYTRGEVMTYGGKPIYAAFHASSGGRTAGSGETGTELPYLKTRLDREDAVNPNQEWKVVLTTGELTKKLRAKGYNIGNLKRIELSPLDMEEGKPTKDRYASFRVKSVKFTGTLKTVEVPGTELRWALGLHSTLFDIRHGSGRTVKPNLKGSIEFKGKTDETLTIAGRGMGHGLGLSQWGAYGMAQKQKYKYRDILARYYTNVELQKLY